MAKRYDPHNPFDPPMPDYGHMKGPTYPSYNHAPQARVKHHHGGLTDILRHAGNAVGRYGNQFGGPQRSPTSAEYLRGAAARKNRG
jgi:hypothetical protein